MARKKRRRKNIPLIVTVILLGIAMIGMCVYIATDKYMQKNPALDGEYISAVNISDEVYSNVALYLSTVQGVEITSSDIEKYIGSVEITTMINITKSSGGQGTYETSIDEDSYNMAVNQVYYGLGEELKDIIAERLTKVGYDSEAEGTDIDSIITGALGKNIDEYLSECELTIVPLREDIVSGIGIKGEYVIKDGIITITTNGETIDHSYIYHDNTLAITDIPMILSKKDNNEAVNWADESKEVVDEENN